MNIHPSRKGREIREIRPRYRAEETAERRKSHHQRKDESQAADAMASNPTKPATNRPQRRVTAGQILSMPPKWLSMYDDFITKNAGQVSQIESALRSLTYIIPGWWPHLHFCVFTQQERELIFEIQTRQAASAMPRLHPSPSTRASSCCRSTTTASSRRPSPSCRRRRSGRHMRATRGTGRRRARRTAASPWCCRWSSTRSCCAR